MASPLQVLKQFWGYDSFRSLQADVIDSVMDGKDTIALLHTGAGKSVCYQIPAMCLPGKTVVISPLIALMQDQVESLNNRGISAKALYSGLGHKQVDLILDNFVNGPLKFLYVSPERLETELFLARFKKADVSLIAVDESHCISQWGHDFRPSYTNIVNLRQWQPKTPIIAVTATATPAVVEDVSEKLGLRGPQIFKSSFGRDNLSLSIILSENKMNVLHDVLSKMNGSGIIYVRSRAKVEQLSKYLNKQGLQTEYYHGGMTMKDRMEVQQNWIENQTQIIVCTNAFGMGVDKPDVRYVIHCDVPPSIEEYYQEAGRGGRDGQMSYAISIVGYSDFVKLQQIHNIAFPEFDYLASFYYKLCNFLKVGYGSGSGETFDINFEEFSNTYRIPIGSVYSCLNILEKEEWLFMSGANRRSSKIVFTSNKRNISLSSRNSGLKSEMLLYLLRNYEGIFTDFVDIDEGKIANALDVNRDKIIFELKVMDRESILSYQPSTILPQITFICDRPQNKSFSIDKKMYKQREGNARTKMDSILHFMTSEGCRQVAILKYFGEESTPCGICDICKGSKQAEFTKEEKNALFVHLRKQVQNGRLFCVDYLQMWPYNKRKKALACVNQLYEEKMIDIDDNNIITILNHG